MTQCGLSAKLNFSPILSAKAVLLLFFIKFTKSHSSLCDIMKNKTLKELIENYPNEISFEEIVDFENFDERLSVVDCIVVNSIGVNKGFIEFIPDNNPPLNKEILCWIWAIRPDLTNEILQKNISEDFECSLKSYLNNSMDKFWDYIS